MMGAFNQISYRSYCQLGGCLNSDLAKHHYQRGGRHYTTYHHIGQEQAYWKQDKPKGPSQCSKYTPESVPERHHHLFWD